MLWRRQDAEKDREEFVRENQEKFERMKKLTKNTEKPGPLFRRFISAREDWEIEKEV